MRIIAMNLLALYLWLFVSGCSVSGKIEPEPAPTPTPVPQHGERGIIQQWKAITQPEHDR